MKTENRDYPGTTVEKHLSEVIFQDRKKALEQRNKNVRKKILTFVTQYHPALPNLKTRASRTYSWEKGNLCKSLPK